MKKLIIASLLAVGLVQHINAASTTTTIAVSGMSNLLSIVNGSANISQIIITAPAATAANVSFVDTTTAALGYTNAAYIATTTYATNVITCWTNFFLIQNCTTNVGIIDVTNTVAAATYAKPVILNMTAPTNQSAVVSGNFQFTSGVWVTNKSLGTATVTITYQQ